MSEDSDLPAPTAPAEPPESGFVYRTVTRYWPRIAVGLVAAVGIAEWLIQGLTADTSLQFYVFAWATTTGGLWFLFDKAESTASGSAKSRSAAWLTGGTLRSWTAAVPMHFASMFDRLFGERHFSLKCFTRSAMASVAAVLVLSAIRAMKPDELGGELGQNPFLTALLLGVFTFVTNVVPNYVSLLQTRWTLAWTSSNERLAVAVGADLVLTSLVSLTWISSLASVVDGATPVEQIRDVLGGGLSSIWFFSGFFTSVWLWLYAASVMVSRVLLRMGGGVGFLLRVTDVENQPFRSVGFVSVLIVSGLFALGLPLVLL